MDILNLICVCHLSFSYNHKNADARGALAWQGSVRLIWRSESFADISGSSTVICKEMTDGDGDQSSYRYCALQSTFVLADTKFNKDLECYEK
jgi:hypothetical protein